MGFDDIFGMIVILILAFIMWKAVDKMNNTNYSDYKE